MSKNLSVNGSYIFLIVKNILSPKEQFSIVLNLLCKNVPWIFPANKNMFLERFKNVPIELSKRYFWMFKNIFGYVNVKGTLHYHVANIRL